MRGKRERERDGESEREREREGEELTNSRRSCESYIFCVTLGDTFRFDNGGGADFRFSSASGKCITKVSFFELK